jgi:LMBR1-like membrane protein
VEQIIAELPEEDYADWVVSSRGEETYTVSKLVKLHTKTMDIVRYKQRTEALLNSLHGSAFELEDVLRAAESRSWAANRIEWSFSEPRKHRMAAAFDRIEYVWKMYLEVPLLKVLSVLSVVMSAAVVWSECTFWSTEVGSRPDLSPFSQLLNIPGLGLVGTMLFIFVPISYMALCAFYSLFKLRLFNYYHIIPHHQTDSNSLLFSAAWLCRLTAPLAFNFLLLVHQFECTSFSVVLSSMNIVPVVGNTFNWFFPALLVLLCVVTFFNLGGRVLTLLKIKRFQFTDTFNDTQIDEGRDLLVRERRRRTHGFHSLGIFSTTSSSSSSSTASLVGASSSSSTPPESSRTLLSMRSSSASASASTSSSLLRGAHTTALSDLSDLSDSSDDERQGTFDWFTSRVAGAVQTASVAGRRALRSVRRGRRDGSTHTIEDDRPATASTSGSSSSSRGSRSTAGEENELMPWPRAPPSNKNARSSYRPGARTGSRFTVASNPWEDEFEDSTFDDSSTSSSNRRPSSSSSGGPRFEPLVLDDL